MKKLTFNDNVKDRYYVRRDQCGDEFIALRGAKALGNGGLDHIYLIGPNMVGLWITSGQINRTVHRLQLQVPDLKVEQLGDTEAVLSAPISSLFHLCKSAGARVRPRLSPERKKHLSEQTKRFRFSKTSNREANGQLNFAF